MENAQPQSVPIVRLGDREGTIWHAASKGDLAKLKELLRCDAALVNAGDELQMTPLMWAVWEGRPGTVRCLLQQPGLKVDAVDRYHRTAAYWAADYGRTELLRLLIAAGADVTIARKDAISSAETTPLSAARRSNSPECVALLLAATNSDETCSGSKGEEESKEGSHLPHPAPLAVGDKASKRPPVVDTSLPSGKPPHQQHYYHRLLHWHGDSGSPSSHHLIATTSPCFRKPPRRKLPYLTPQSPFRRLGLWWLAPGRRRHRRRKGRAKILAANQSGTLRTVSTPPPPRRAGPGWLDRLQSWLHG